MVLASILLLQPMVGSFALAKKKKPMKAYSFIAEGGKASQGECDGVRKLPKMKKLGEFSKTGAYMGSELQTSEMSVKGGAEMWVHFFRDKGSCNAVLAKTPSALAPQLKEVKRELPPDDSAEGDDDSDTEQTNAPAEGPAAEGPDSE